MSANQIGSTDSAKKGVGTGASAPKNIKSYVRSDKSYKSR